MTDQLADLVQVYKALGHPARLRIMAMLRSGELCVCQITAILELAPSTVSAHLAELRRAGLLSERKEGRWVYYRVTVAEDAVEIFESLWKRVRRDSQIRSDATLLKQLRAIPVEELCSAGLDAARLSTSSAGQT